MQDLGLVPTESPNLPYPEGAWADFSSISHKLRIYLWWSVEQLVTGEFTNKLIQQGS